MLELAHMASIHGSLCVGSKHDIGLFMDFSKGLDALAVWLLCHDLGAQVCEPGFLFVLGECNYVFLGERYECIYGGGQEDTPSLMYCSGA